MESNEKASAPLTLWPLSGLEEMTAAEREALVRKSGAASTVAAMAFAEIDALRQARRARDAAVATEAMEWVLSQMCLGDPRPISPRIASFMRDDGAAWIARRWGQK